MRHVKSSLRVVVGVLLAVLMTGCADSSCEKTAPVGIFAHRGCSYEFPENTLEAFRAACEVQGLRGIEFDIQLSKDDEIVVIHDETVDRTTGGTGRVADFTLEELKRLQIDGSDTVGGGIPAAKDVLELCRPYCERNGLLLNIELKNSNIRYEGMESKILALVEEFGLEEYVIYSSFNPDSLVLIKRLNPSARTAILAYTASSCLDFALSHDVDALHPRVDGLDIGNLSGKTDLPVRVFGSEEIYPSRNPFGKIYSMDSLADMGVTDIFTNNPCAYLR